MSNQVKSASPAGKSGAGQSQSMSNFSAFSDEIGGEHREDFQQLLDDVGDSLTVYCKKRPMVAAFTVFAIGFYMGWKIKPW